MTVDLSQYLGQEVQVTYENGDTDTGKVSKNSHVCGNSELHYRFQGSSKTSIHTKDGFVWSYRPIDPANIVKIKPLKMNKYEQLENQIKKLQAEVERLKKEEKIPTSFSRRHSLEFLNNPTSHILGFAFVWSETPQGEDYWRGIESALRRNPSHKVPQEAINQIQSWVIESYKQQYGV